MEGVRRFDFLELLGVVTTSTGQFVDVGYDTQPARYMWLYAAALFAETEIGRKKVQTYLDDTYS